MSGLLAGKVWLSNLDCELKPLAATLADIADDDGTHIFPSVAYVAWRLGRSDRSVQLGLAALVRISVLELVGHHSGGRGLTREYRLIEANLPSRPPWKSPRKGESASPFLKVSSAAKGEIGTAKGCNPQQKRVKPTSPDSSLPVSEPSGCARSDSGKKITGEPQIALQTRAETHSVFKTPPTAILDEVSRVAATKTFARSDPEFAQLQRGILRKHVTDAYLDCRNLGEEAACREALDQAILDLRSNRWTIELRGVDDKELREVCWKRLTPLLKVFTAITDYTRRQDEVLGAILRITCEEALRLKRAIGDAA